MNISESIFLISCLILQYVLWIWIVQAMKTRDILKMFIVVV